MHNIDIPFPLFFIRQFMWPKLPNQSTPFNSRSIYLGNDFFIFVNFILFEILRYTMEVNGRTAEPRPPIDTIVARSWPLVITSQLGSDDVHDYACSRQRSCMCTMLGI